MYSPLSPLSFSSLSSSLILPSSVISFYINFLLLRPSHLLCLLSLLMSCISNIFISKRVVYGSTIKVKQDFKEPPFRMEEKCYTKAARCKLSGPHSRGQLCEVVKTVSCLITFIIFSFFYFFFNLLKKWAVACIGIYGSHRTHMGCVSVTGVCAGTKVPRRYTASPLFSSCLFISSPLFSKYPPLLYILLC